MSQTSGVKDLYKVLRVHKTATKHEIKNAYRKLAMALHPDRHDGCEIKSKEFQEASEAYAILSDHDKRKSYDSTDPTRYNKNRRNAPPPNYRKVYSPRAPPGFKTFDAKKHYDMHYGDGMMHEEIDRARRRAAAASSRGNQGYEYDSPLGKGFSFGENGAGAGGAFYRNPYSKRSPQGPRSKYNTNNIVYEEVQVFDTKDMYDSTNNERQAKQTVKSRMEARRQTRLRNRGDPTVQENLKNDESSCTIM